MQPCIPLLQPRLLFILSSARCRNFYIPHTSAAQSKNQNIGWEKHHCAKPPHQDLTMSSTGDISNLTDAQQEALAQYLSVTNSDTAQAIALLARCQWNVEVRCPLLSQMIGVHDTKLLLDCHNPLLRWRARGRSSSRSTSTTSRHPSCRRTASATSTRPASREPKILGLIVSFTL